MYVCTFDQGTYLKIHTPRRTLKYYTNRALCPTLVCYVKDSFHTSKGIGIVRKWKNLLGWQVDVGTNFRSYVLWLAKRNSNLD